MGSYLFNLLLFPLIGGYFIITRLESYKYINQRKSNQDILFNAIIAGIPLLIVSLIFTSTISYFFKDKVTYLRENFFPIRDHYLGTCVCSFFFAVAGTKFLNLFINETKAVKNAIGRIGNELELLFCRSFTDYHLIQITLKNDKVYIGWIEVLPEPSQSPYIQVIPFLSGYRDE